MTPSRIGTAGTGFAGRFPPGEIPESASVPLGMHPGGARGGSLNAKDCLPPGPTPYLKRKEVLARSGAPIRPAVATARTRSKVFANDHRTRCRIGPINAIDNYSPRHEQFAEGWSPEYAKDPRDFADCARHGRTPRSDLDLAIDITPAIYAGYVSAHLPGREDVPRS